MSDPTEPPPTADSDSYVPELPQEPIDLWVPPAPGELQDPNQFDPLPVEVGPGDPPVGPIERVQPDDGTYPDPIATPNSVIPRTGGEESIAAEVSDGPPGSVDVAAASLISGGLVLLAIVLIAVVGRFARWHSGRRAACAVVVVGLIVSATVATIFAPVEAFGSETFYGKSSERLLDTRTNGGKIGPNGTRTINAGHGNRALAINIVAVNASGDGYLIVYGCNSSAPVTSVVNYTPNVAISNAVVVHPDSSGCLKIQAKVSSTHVVVDYTGSVAAGRYQPANTRRYDGNRGAGSTLTLSGFTKGAGVSLNLTAVYPTGFGHFQAYPCNQGRPSTASAGNYEPGRVIASGQVVEADSAGKVCVWTKVATRLIVDYYGAILDNDATDFHKPTRILDSRVWTSPARTNFVLDTDSSKAPYRTYVLNVTVVAPSAIGHLVVYPCDSGPYNGTTINFLAYQTIAHSTIAIPDVDGQICFKSTTSVQLIVDRFGYMQTTGISIQFSPNSFTYTGGNSYGLGTTSMGFTETVVPGYQSELDAGYVVSLGQTPPGSANGPVWIGAHNSTHGSAFGHIDNISNGKTVRLRWGSTTYARTVQGRYKAPYGSSAPTGKTFYLQTSAPASQAWLIHN